MTSSECSSISRGSEQLEWPQLGAIAPREREQQRGQMAQQGMAVTDSAEIKRLVRGFYEEVVSTGDGERVPAFIAPGCVEAEGHRRVESGIDGIHPA